MTPDYPKPPFPAQHQPMPGSTDAMQPRPDHGEKSYKGSDRLKGMKAVITGGDSGIGRAVAIAYAREGADVLISFLNETDEANEVKRLVEQEGRKAVLVPGDLQDAQHCREVIKKAVDELGGIDVLVNNAAHQATFKDIGDISDEEWEMTFRTNIHAMFYLTKAAVPHMQPGSAIINTASVNSDMPNPMLLAYATTKGAIQNFTGGLAQMLASAPVNRPNSQAPTSCWRTPCPATLPAPRWRSPAASRSSDGRSQASRDRLWPSERAHDLSWQATPNLKPAAAPRPETDPWFTPSTMPA
jgi:NAD(P)-dependent dehydrogenase (short-subunit alcohol dehydrogenase family)